MFNGNPQKNEKIPPAVTPACPHGYVAEVLDNPDNVASATGATGLLPTPPQDAAQAAGYSDIYAVPQQPQQVAANLPKKEKR